MRTTRLLSLICLIFSSVNLLFAADRVVQHNGPVGTYGSISAAITAAADGDNIVINNRTDALPWTENLTINKTLTFVSAVDNVQWLLDGTISIVTAEGRVITIVGMKNMAPLGHITKTGAVPVNRTKLNITYSEIVGNITTVSGVDLFLGSSKAGVVTFSYGKLIGNELNSAVCNTDANASEDVTLIIGNRVGTIGSLPITAFEINTTSHYLNFSNNLVHGLYNGVYITSLKSGASASSITNCVLTTSTSSGGSALYIGQSSGNLNVDNSMLCGNFVQSNPGACGVRAANNGGTLTNFTYNLYYSPGGTCLTLNAVQGNVLLWDVEKDNINTLTGLPINSWTGYVNAGSPMNTFLDLDLTRNDIGVYGGSYSLDNFMPFMNNTESSRVIYVNTPRIVNQGTTMSVQAIGYDK